VSAPEACEPLRRPCVAPLQPDDAGIRPLVLCAATAAERRRQPGVERTVVGDKARRLVLAGRAGRRARRPEPRGPPKPVYPEAIARSMLSVKPLSPSLHVRAIERMVPRPCGDKTNHHTRKRFLAPSAPPRPLARDRPTLATFAEAYQARWTVVRRAVEGWHKKSIADGLKRSRSPV
jgi:hypothetical protein